MEETLGDRLTQAMKRAGVKNPEVAKAAGVHEVTVSRWRHDAQSPEDAELEKVAALLRKRGALTATAAWLRYGQGNGTASGTVAREEQVFYQSPLPRDPEVVFVSPPAAQRARHWLEGFLLEIAESGADQDFIASSRRLLLNPANYEHGFGAPAGTRENMDDEQKLRHMQALAVGVREALKYRLKQLKEKRR